MFTSDSSRSTRHRWMVLLVAIVATFTAGVAFATPVAAKLAVGYVRLAHLSPDTPEVDVYLSRPSDPSFKTQVFEGVGYGVVSQYLAIPAGDYLVAMRPSGAGPSTTPVISATVTVATGAAYTVAGVGKHADLGLKILTDDLSAPPKNKAKVRVIQASVAAPVLDVSTAGGETVAKTVAFATTTDYKDVEPGLLTLRVTPTGSASATTLTAQLTSGWVYSLLVLDGPNGLQAQLRIDARGPGTPPYGGIDAGGGGTGIATAAGLSPIVFLASGLATLIALMAIALRMRRLANRRV